MTIAASAGPASICVGCGTEIAATLLSCPACHRLVHAVTLKELAARAESAAARDDAPAALAAWRESLELLPAASRQRTAVEQKIAALTSITPAAPSELPSSGRWKWLATFGPAGLLIWKFKFLLVALLTKGKLLLLGLTNLGTLASMFAAMALYWTQWGMWFALGFVVSIYIHEMGHVAALRRYGIAASAPMFIPGLGALVRLKQAPTSVRENARIGLAGPVWGLGAAGISAGVGALGGGSMFYAIAHAGAWLNLFNLTPIWQLDGGRGFSSLTRPHRWLATGALGVAWLLTRDGIVLLAALVAAWRSVGRTDGIAEDWGALRLFAFVALALAVVFQLTQARVTIG